MTIAVEVDRSDRTDRELDLAHLLGMLAHDLRNPLAGLKGRLQLAQRRLRRHDAVQANLLDVDRMLALVERMNHQLAVVLDASQIQRQAFTVQREYTDLDAVVRRSVATVQVAFPDTSIDFEPSPRELIGFWDPNRLEHSVMTALLTNAVRFSSAGRPVHVRTRHVDTSARVEVDDEGIGVPDEEQQLIFEFGRRASNAKGCGGAGLGLFVTREIVELHGGTIGVEAARERGARFWFTLPLNSAGHETAHS